MKKHLFILLGILTLSANAQNTYYVATTGSNSNNGSIATPWLTIQYGVNQLQPGDTLYVRGGTYSEKLSISSSGLPANYTTIKNYPNETPIIDAISFSDANSILWTDQSYLTIDGFHFTNNIFNNAEGITITGSAHHVEILNNKISNIKFDASASAPVNTNTNAVPLNIWADQALDSIHNILVKGNEVFNNQTGFSENITGGGNFSNFIIEDNLVHDNTNIGIDVTGNYQVCPTPSLDQGRNGIIRNNVVYNCVSLYSESAGIYIDGGKNIIVENNTCHHNGYGGEIGCEQDGSTSNIIFRSNVFYQNRSAGLHIGGYDPLTTGVVTNSKVQNNTFYQNDSNNNFDGELIFSKLQNCIIENNIFYTSAQNVLLYAYRTQTNLIMNYNLIYADAGASVIEVSGNWNTTGISNFYTASGFGANSVFGNPMFSNVATGDFHISSSSPAVDAGNPSYIVDSNGEFDLDGENRINNTTIDCGADEYYTTTGLSENTENTFLIYPNPFINQFVIKGDLNNETIVVLNQLGEKIMELKASGSTQIINLEKYNTGVYFIGMKNHLYKVVKL